MPKLLGRRRCCPPPSCESCYGRRLRPAGLLCGEAIKYKSSITFQYAGGTANAKSVLSVLGACVKSGDEITLVCEGEDEQAAIDALVALIEGGLGE